jgi:transposase
MNDDALPIVRGLTVAEVAARYRVSPDRVRGWIARGSLRAFNRRDTRSGRPSWVITPETLEAFERGRGAAAPLKPARRKKRTTEVDYYPD